MPHLDDRTDPNRLCSGPQVADADQVSDHANVVVSCAQALSERNNALSARARYSNNHVADGKGGAPINGFIQRSQHRNPVHRQTKLRGVIIKNRDRNDSQSRIVENLTNRKSASSSGTQYDCRTAVSTSFHEKDFDQIASEPG